MLPICKHTCIHMVGAADHLQPQSPHVRREPQVISAWQVLVQQLHALNMDYNRLFLLAAGLAYPLGIAEPIAIAA